jgi:hypothetical protein
MTLTQIAEVLGCSRTAASRLRAGAYDRPGSDLTGRYASLMTVVAQAQTVPEITACAHAICVACPRDDCIGCRIAEIV